jgi:sn-glycerol 3-phosphate transport system permease protein
MQTPNRDQFWQGVAVVLPLAIMSFFVLSEGAGFVRLGEFLWGALLSIPAFIGDIASYYQALPADYLWPSALIGALLGASLTLIVAMSHSGQWKLPALDYVWAGALLLGVLLFLVGMSFLLAVVISIAGVLLLNAALEPKFRAFFTPPTLQALLRPAGLKAAGRGLALGAITGGISSQILSYSIQHCTYSPEATALQYQIGLGVTFVSSFLLLLPMWSWVYRRPEDMNPSTAGYYRNFWMPYLLLAPNVLILALFIYYPAVQIVNLSLKARIFPLPQERFVCLDNYVKLTEDPIYRNSLETTVFITLALVIITMGLALAIAVLASQKVRGAHIYRTLLIWPFALSPVVAGVIFLSLFREGDAGMINYLLGETLGYQGSWFRDADLAPWVVIAAAVWNGLGFNILFYIAGLQSVPEDLLEAAALDGANVTQRFFIITFPLLSPYSFFLLIANITYAFYGIYGAVDALTQGGPPLGVGGVEGGATNVLIYNLYEQAFGSGGSAGSAAAQSLLLFFLVAGLTLLQFRYVENRVTYNA